MGIFEWIMAPKQKKKAADLDRRRKRLETMNRNRLRGRASSLNTRKPPSMLPVGPHRPRRGPGRTPNRNVDKGFSRGIERATGSFGKSITKINKARGNGTGGASYQSPKGTGRKIDNGPLKSKPTGQGIVNALPYKRKNPQGKYPVVRRKKSPFDKAPKRNPRGPRPTIR
jgi:hypothetical protein